MKTENWENILPKYLYSEVEMGSFLRLFLLQSADISYYYFIFSSPIWNLK